ncbi:Putative Linear gramicidin synthase subunit C (plasmid) [Mesorhizobium loti]|nr:Putative Linear gramicidin synthase subunit C [Mesorhizobium loti]BCH04845.1 hypothetical protein MesoLj131b_68440 [Mesorhizobium sp. 131-2-5]
MGANYCLETVGWRPIFARQAGDQSSRSICITIENHGDFGYVWVIRYNALNFPKFNPVAIDLDLVVSATTEEKTTTFI